MTALSDKGREVLADAIVATRGDSTFIGRDADYIRDGADIRVWASESIAAMLAFREEGRLAALDEAAKVAREMFADDGWNGHIRGAADSIATSILALKDKP